jgi:hypothetical protein
MYTTVIVGLNANNARVSKTVKLVEGEKHGSVPVSPQWFNCAFHVIDNSGLIYDVYSALGGMLGGKLTIKNGVATNPNGEIYIVKAVEVKGKDGKIESQNVDAYLAVQAK